MKSAIIYLVIGVALVLMVGKITVQMNPFHMELPHWRLAVCIPLLAAVFFLMGRHHEKIGRDKAFSVLEEIFYKMTPEEQEVLDSALARIVKESVESSEESIDD